MQSVRDCLSASEVLPVDRQALESALRLPGSDFEDNIQISAAIEAQLDGIVTRDPTGYAASSLAIFSPLKLLKHLTL